MNFPACCRRLFRRTVSSHRCGNITVGVQHSPHLNRTLRFHIEDEVRVTAQGDASQPRQVKFNRVARGACRRSFSDGAIGRLQRIDKAERDRFAGFVQIVADRLLDVAARLLSEENRSCGH